MIKQIKSYSHRSSIRKIMGLTTLVIACFILTVQLSLAQSAQHELNLNGKWETGYGRRYTQRTLVPGLASDPEKYNEDTLWYRKVIALPKGEWTSATLRLMGARFNPSVWVNGQMVSAEPGGMAPTQHTLNHSDVKPGRTITLEIALLPLDKLHPADASKIPPADLWRSNISSHLWDDVSLQLHGNQWIDRVYAYADIKKDQMKVRYQLQGQEGDKNKTIVITLKDTTGNSLLTESFPLVAKVGEVEMDLGGKCSYWSPETPTLYDVTVELKEGNTVLDAESLRYGHRDFRVNKLQFELNANPVKLRSASVVWHRWVRDPESSTLAWDEAWFEKNIVQRLKDHGANTLRFHLGMPPERFLDLCDEYGLMVQAEWLFFHGMKASRESLLEQWPDWFDLCMRHPSVVLLHAWNETEGEDELKLAFEAIDEVAKDYPSLVIGHRDVIHVHKYWWSLFENLGLYYDSYKQFPKPVMADEFGGNYLDGNGDMGDYPTIPSAFRRFLGENHAREERLFHHTLSNGKVAEYWRRIDVAGFSPFCALGPPEDGNHWFMGPLKEGNPKPVWAALTSAWSPTSVSLDMWDKNYLPGQRLSVPLHFFNDTKDQYKLDFRIEVKSLAGAKKFQSEGSETLKPFDHVVKHVEIEVSSEPGSWIISVEHTNPPAAVKYPVVSSWSFQTYKPMGPAKQMLVGIPENEKELIAMAEQHGFKIASPEKMKKGVVVYGFNTMSAISDSVAFGRKIEAHINAGVDVLLLDAGPLFLGQGYLKDDQLGPLQGVAVVENAPVTKLDLPFGVRALFQEVAEPESHIHPAHDSTLWSGLNLSSTSLWNGLRGGLIVPATGMEISGLNQASFQRVWTSRGADENLIQSASPYYAYEMEGFFDFSTKPSDEEVKERLRKKVNFLVEDAPALKLKINPNAPVKEHDLRKLYDQAAESHAESINALAVAGKDLVRSPVYRITYGNKKGSLIISQLLTRGRLAEGFGEEGHYGLRYDPVAVQVVLNMISDLSQQMRLVDSRNKN